MELCSAWDYHSPSTSLRGFFTIKILKWQFHTLPTSEVPGSSKQNHQHLEWPSSTMELHSISCFPKKVICHVTIKWLYQQQWEPNHKTFQWLKLLMSALPPAEMMPSDLKSQRISQCASYFKPPPTCLFSYLLYISIHLCLCWYNLLQVGSKNWKTEFGEVNAIKILFYLGQKWRVDEGTCWTNSNKHCTR